ncbi:MAG TPA: PEP-CTERM sorting domain-containing protein [Caldimonas sp.]|jgi:hypothetical protein|nr:PEP-CTERM sorting domain-containing protein [Caldimonas sp.]HEX2540021.1 PEP-CTERM sorting domain-containing protein [Caldimonas sp.]
MAVAAIPEPSTVLLIALGLGSLVWRRRAANGRLDPCTPRQPIGAPC